MGKNLNFKNWGNSINKLFGGGKKNASPPPNTSKYSSINTTGSGQYYGGDYTDPLTKKTPSLKEANEFYTKNKNLNTIYTVDASTVDLNFVDTKGWVIDEVYIVQTLYRSKNGSVLGKLNLRYKGNNQVMIQDDIYDFNLEFSNPLNFSEFISPRNIFTGIGQLYSGEGTSFTFRFSGLNTIKNNTVKVMPQSHLYKQYP